MASTMTTTAPTITAGVPPSIKNVNSFDKTINKISNTSFTTNTLTSMLQDIVSWILGFVDNVVYLLRFVKGKTAPKFFSNGWGDLDVAYKAQESFLTSLEQGDVSSITLTDDDIDFSSSNVSSGGDNGNGITIREGLFDSPVAHMLPPESKKCRFYIVEPKSTTTKKTITTNNNNSDGDDDLYVVMMPATGEQGKRERLGLAKKLATKYGWKSILITAPLYGKRRPKSQRLFFLPKVSDALIQSIAIIQETTAVVRYYMTSSSKSSSNNSKVIMTGFSWGSAMSSLTTTSVLMSGGIDGSRIGHVPYVGSASPVVFVGGVLKNGIDWDALLEDAQNRKLYPNVGTVSNVQSIMYDELNKTQLAEFVTRYQAMLAKRENNQKQNDNGKSFQPYPSVVRMFCMKNDGFIPPPFSQVYVNDIERLVQFNKDGNEKDGQSRTAASDAASTCDYKMTWLTGGHVVAAMTRPIFHKRAIIEVGLSLQKQQQQQQQSQEMGATQQRPKTD